MKGVMMMSTKLVRDDAVKMVEREREKVQIVLQRMDDFIQDLKRLGTVFPGLFINETSATPPVPEPMAPAPRPTPPRKRRRNGTKKPARVNAKPGEMRKAVIKAFAHYGGQPVTISDLARFVHKNRPASLARKRMNAKVTRKRVSNELYRMEMVDGVAQRDGFKGREVLYVYTGKVKR